MDIDQLKKHIQQHLTDGLVTIVGTGLSIAEGVPGMAKLRDHLMSTVPEHATGTLPEEWEPIAEYLKQDLSLENALLKKTLSDELQCLIVELTAQLILDAEHHTITEVISGGRILRFTKLLKHLIKANSGIPIITTNYDRLLEVAAERGGLGVDTLFVGQHIGRLNPKESRSSFCRGYQSMGAKKIRFEYRDHVRILKPHGSLDWFLLDDDPVRCPFPLTLPRLIITPGLNKFRTGYDSPFDRHREKANQDIDKAVRYLIIGYGFNDSHLETHLARQLEAGKPAIVLTRTLSPAAKIVVSKCAGVMAITANPGKSGAWISTQDNKSFLPGPNIWDLGVLVSEVLEP